MAATPVAGAALAEAALADGSAMRAFMAMVKAQGGDASVFEDPAAFHRPGATLELAAWESGFIAEMDTTALGWAVQRTGAGREKAGEPVDPHAGIAFHARRGKWVNQGEPLATIFATQEQMLNEPVAILERAIRISAAAPEPVDLVSRVFTLKNAESHIENAVR
jgi:pyrimidine-nucleoside phosphorylase